MKLTVNIDSENEGLDPATMAEALRSIAEHVEEIYGEWDGPIRDYNGNKVGNWTVDTSDYVARLMEE